MSQESKNLRVLTLTDFYLPGYRGGGPIRTLANMADWLGKEIDFLFAVCDHDLGVKEPYPNIRTNEWQPVGNAEVLYLPVRGRMRAMAALLSKGRPYDAVYLNSFFSPWFTILPLLLRRLGLVRKVPVIVAPRGEFSVGAIQIKSAKKRLYMWVARLLGLYRNVIWQASSEYEAQDIRREFDPKAEILVAPDLLPARTAPANTSLSKPPKESGKIRAIFLSRISPKKNLDGALRLLQSVRGDVEFNIYGPVDDQQYWSTCQQLIREMPAHVRVTYHGPIGHAEVGRVMGENHLFLFPTHGENFGHVILESLLAGTPVLLSDQTPWRDLPRNHAGWDLPLSDFAAFQAALQEMTDMDVAAYDRWAAGALSFAHSYLQNPEPVELNRRLFQRARRQER